MSTPRRLGNFDIVRVLATGGMGEVFLARQGGAGGFSRAVVVKRLLPHLARDEGFVKMFLNEGRLAGLINHPNIAQVYELGESEGSYYLAMEHVHGKSLRELQKTLAAQGRSLGPPLAARICIDALHGLHAAHSLVVDGKKNPVVHRDMSPDNILVGFNGVSRVIDFGIARTADAASTTQTGTVKGKFPYMAPERFAVETSMHDPRVDVYAMAVVLFEVLCGRRPFASASDAALVGQILQQPPPRPNEVNPLLDDALSELILKGLAKTPEERWQTAQEMADALERYLQQRGHVVATAAVASFMRAVFGDEAADSNPTLTQGALAIPGTEPILTTGRAEVMQSRQRRVWVAVALGAVGLLAVAGGVGYAASRRQVEVVTVPTPVPVQPAPTVTPPPPTPSPPPAEVRRGRVAFRVKPWGEIWQGDEKLGVTPNVKVERPAGRQTFTVKNPAFAPRDIAVEVLPDTEVSVKVDLTAAR